MSAWCGRLTSTSRPSYVIALPIRHVGEDRRILIPRLAGGELFIFIMRLRIGEDDREDDEDGDEKRRLYVQEARFGRPAGRSFRVFRLLRLGERELDLLLDLLFDLLFGERELDLFLFVFLFFLAPPALQALASALSRVLEHWFLAAFKKIAARLGFISFKRRRHVRSFGGRVLGLDIIINVNIKKNFF